MHLVFSFLFMQESDKNFYENISKNFLSNQEAFEVRNNFVGFFDLLYRIDKRNKEKERDENKSSKNLQT